MVFWAVETIFEEKSGLRSRTEKRFLMELLNLGHASTVWLFCRGGALPNKLLEDF
jgi:hypothetical protein